MIILIVAMTAAVCFAVGYASGWMHGYQIGNYDHARHNPWAERTVIIQREKRP